MKKIISLIICVSLLFAAMAFPSLAETGTIYEINSRADWNTYFTSAQMGASTNAAVTYLLKCDIGTGVEDDAPLTAGLTNLYATLRGAKADGAKPVINININSGSTRGGIFQYLRAGACVENIEIAGTVTSTAAYTGGLAGDTQTGTGNVTIKNVTNRANVTSTNTSGYVGGILGGQRNAGDLLIENCENFGTIEGKKLAGGLLGGINYASVNSTKFQNCFNGGTIVSDSDVGGIIGGANNAGKNLSLINCANAGTVKATGKNAGGIAGQSKATASLTVEKCWNSANITGGSFACGIVGSIASDSSNTFRYLYNTGDITATAETSSYAGGITDNFGNESTTSTLTEAYTTGTISASTRISAIYRNIYGTEPTKLYAAADKGYSSIPDTVAVFDKPMEQVSLTELDPAIWASAANGNPILKSNMPRLSTGAYVSYHKATLTVGENGSVNKDPETYVKSGETIQFLITPSEGYAIDTVKNDEVAIPGLNAEGDTYSFTPSADFTLSVAFAEATPAEPAFSGDSVPFRTIGNAADFTGKLTAEEIANITDKPVVVAFSKISNQSVITDYGMLIAMTDKGEEFTIGQPGVVKASAFGRIENFNLTGSYGILFYGNAIQSETTYYIRPYFIYGEETIYGDVIIVNGIAE